MRVGLPNFFDRRPLNTSKRALNTNPTFFLKTPRRSVTHSSMACREHINVESSCLLGLSYKLCFLYETNFIFNLCLFYFSSPEINGRYRRQRKDSEDKLYLDDLWISCMNDGMDNGTNYSEFLKIYKKYKGILIVGNAKTRHV